MKDTIALMRLPQWYKNIVVFLALFFTNNMFNMPLLSKTILGFISLCFVSSAYYIVNDIHDAPQDRKHPEKKNRPIASGKISVPAAWTLSITLFAVSLASAYQLKPVFALFPAALYLINILYSYSLRKIALVDVHVISLNFLLKATAGAVLIDVPASVWLIASVYFIALFLAVSKRLGELMLLGDEAPKFKQVYEVYTRELLERMMLIIVSILLFTYIMYTFKAHEKPYMMLTIPFASFMIFRYMYFISVNHEAVRRAEYIFRDKQMLACFALWITTSFVILKFVL
ncbi:MAG: decaprenyl-phosphate phosphoribosyltransferase [Candidatus Altiarchaeota archaeon]